MTLVNESSATLKYEEHFPVVAVFLNSGLACYVKIPDKFDNKLVRYFVTLVIKDARRSADAPNFIMSSNTLPTMAENIKSVLSLYKEDVGIVAFPQLRHINISRAIPFIYELEIGRSVREQLEMF